MGGRDDMRYDKKCREFELRHLVIVQYIILLVRVNHLSRLNVRHRVTPLITIPQQNKPEHNYAHISCDMLYISLTTRPC